MSQLARLRRPPLCAPCAEQGLPSLGPVTSTHLAPCRSAVFQKRRAGGFAPRPLRAISFRQDRNV